MYSVWKTKLILVSEVLIFSQQSHIKVNMLNLRLVTIQWATEGVENMNRFIITAATTNVSDITPGAPTEELQASRVSWLPTQNQLTLKT